jgi:hypothetical protein
LAKQACDKFGDLQVRKKSQPALARPSPAAQDRVVRRKWFTPFTFLFITPLVVFWPILFGGYTLSQNADALDSTDGYGGFYDRITVMDPGANVLDEPSLALVARNLAKGRVPLLNMYNGMGAPQVESLLTGTLYILNPVLLALPTNKPLYFDLFNILHVYIFLFGTYVLLRWHASPTAAAAVAMLLAFSGVTFLHLNAIHYRSLVWTPWMLAGLTGVIRGQRLRRCWLLLLAATVACGTAGNVQEFALDLFATCVVGVCEWASLSRPSQKRGLVLSVAALGFGFVIASVAFLPFFLAQAQGWIFIPSGAHRSTQVYDPAFLASWLVPRITGPYSEFLRDTNYHPHPDYSLSGFLLLVLGAITGWKAWRNGVKPIAWMCLVPLVVIAIGLLKIVHLPVFGFVSFVPLLRDIWFVKYHSYLFVLAAIPSVIGLERVLAGSDAESRRLVWQAIAIAIAVLSGVVLYLWLKPNYVVAWGATQPILRETFQKWIVTGIVFIGVAFVLLVRPRYYQGLLLALILAQCVAIFPRGHGKRLPFYKAMLSYPDSTLPHQRLLVSDPANSNLLFERESLAVTDSVINRHFRDYLLRFFETANAGTILQPKQTTPFSDSQALGLRVAGVERLYGYSHDTQYIREFQVLDPLPRAFLIAPETFQHLRNAKIGPENVADVVTRIERDLHTLPQPSNIHIFDETVEVRLPVLTGGAVLVVNQAYSPNWKLDGRMPSMMADLWPAWEVSAGGSTSAAAVYWPTGLTIGIGVSLLSSIVAGLFYWLVVRKEVSVS